jgi:hypothetical protein
VGKLLFKSLRKRSPWIDSHVALALPKSRRVPLTSAPRSIASAGRGGVRDVTDTGSDEDPDERYGLSAPQRLPLSCAADRTEARSSASDFQNRPDLARRASGVSLSGLLGRGFRKRFEWHEPQSPLQTTRHRTTFDCVRSASALTTSRQHETRCDWLNCFERDSLSPNHAGTRSLSTDSHLALALPKSRRLPLTFAPRSIACLGRWSVVAATDTRSDEDRDKRYVLGAPQRSRFTCTALIDRERGRAEANFQNRPDLARRAAASGGSACWGVAS